MQLGLSRMFSRALGHSRRLSARDAQRLAGADEAAVQALGASAPVLSMFRQDFAVLSPDLVHEAQLAVGRR